MALENAKVVGGAIGGMTGGAITTFIFAAFPNLVGSKWEAAITGVVTLAFALYGLWQARNKVTPAQIATAIKEGDVKPSTVAAVAGNTTPGAKP